MQIIVKLLFILFLIFINGFFVTSEFALVAVRKTRIDELVKRGVGGAKLVQNAQRNINLYMSSTQIGITLASLALGWIGEAAVASFIEPLFSFLPQNIAAFSYHTVAIVVAFVIITYLQIVLGELSPKTVALQSAEKAALLIIKPLTFFTYIFTPFIWLLNQSGSLVLKLIGFKAPPRNQYVYSEEEIKLILSQSQQGGAIEREETQMLYNVFQMGDITVKQIMKPRTEVIAFNINEPVRKVANAIKNYPPYSRFPVYKGNIDTIVGFIHMKDLYKLRNRYTSTTPAKCGLIRPILTVPEIKKIDEVFFEMRKRRIHIAVVNDEFGGTAGIVTMEDIIESLVGEIEDEFDNPVVDIRKQPDGSFLVNGRTDISAIREKFNLELGGQGYTTIGGLIFGLLGREPQVGDTVRIGSLSFTVEKVDNKRIRLLRITKLSGDTPQSGAKSS